MTDKPKCGTDNCDRDVFSKGLCSGCYGRQWRAARKAERVTPRQLTTGDTVEAEAMSPGATHLTALNPAEMQEAQGNIKAWLEGKLDVLERDIVEANAALNEAKRNGWATSALTSARNRAVDDETFYNKILAAVEAGHTIIPDFPISVFAVRTEKDKPSPYHQQETWRPAEPDYGPAGIGEYRNPVPEVTHHRTGNPERPWRAIRTGNPVGPITFPSMTARSPIMRATAKAMESKVFDQIGVCHPVVAAPASRQVQVSARAGDPLVIGQVLRKRVGSKQKAVSFIIAWYLNLNEL